VVEIGIGGISRVGVPLECHLLAIDVHGVDCPLSSLSEELEDAGGLAVGEGDEGFGLKHGLFLFLTTISVNYDVNYCQFSFKQKYARAELQKYKKIKIFLFCPKECSMLHWWANQNK
jgi:hypothetical protein